MGEIRHIYRGWVCCESALKAELPWAVRKLQLCAEHVLHVLTGTSALAAASV